MQYSLLIIISSLLLVAVGANALISSARRKSLHHIVEDEGGIKNIIENLDLSENQKLEAERLINAISTGAKVSQDGLLGMSFENYKKLHAFYDHAYDDLSEILGNDIVEAASDKDTMLDLIIMKAKGNSVVKGK